MNNNYINTKKIYTGLIIALIINIIGCARNEWIIDDIRTGTEVSNTNKYIVYFNPRLESNYTRSLSAFPEGCKVHIYAFDDSEDTQCINSSLYESLTPGYLTPTDRKSVV